MIGFRKKHPKRSRDEQILHDKVVERIAKSLRDLGFKEVRTNPGNTHVYPVEHSDKTLYPDVLAISEDEVETICEVETTNTVQEGAVGQWKDYGEASNKFLLIVPQGVTHRAKNILEAHDVDWDNILDY